MSDEHAEKPIMASDADLDGIEVTDETVRRAQLDWYRQHPEVSVAVAAIVKDRLAGLGVSA